MSHSRTAVTTRPGRWLTCLAERAEVPGSCLLLAATNYLVKGRSNLSDASLAFNPRLRYSFCVR